AAADADFVLALYNPKSKKRVRNIEEVREIFLKHRSPDTPVGIVTNASRDAQKKVISTLDAFTKEEISMFSLVIIGNSKTYVKEGYMITPRGYEQKEPSL
ncbi:MAG: cobalt-precorrin-3B C(17)-methyltransferase, partial [Selenomonadaceae bacterium]|nr:cobalt-precorrin-3B C(17)-methyltransferase [Selenomonadaceae bacterium]